MAQERRKEGKQKKKTTGKESWENVLMFVVGERVGAEENNG